ncbi:hypothetical protein C5F47_08110 [Nitrosopumilus cobalaminigenes]|uniref:Uncharacterized protein n=1 Tax=Nitrosopumilus cobalaminigenes TaxID=1470066 RepID=A0A7D5RCL7_9ARCH|nr:hypothetical protein [Nitrosopumilus cobalaminigenes]QLH03505.1 hypothetical protein C5F47_08110 [Nitrosopumilus cobalaminigenes]
MNNEIGRKITSLTLMTIMLAGGMTFAIPGVMPAAHAANANLFVSAENSQFDNYMAGPMVIEVVVIDSDISDTDEGKGEPDVTVQGKDLRMAQATDGNWYGYFADSDAALAADATVGLPGEGLDFGSGCDATSATTAAGISFTDTVGVFFPTQPVNGNVTSSGLSTVCAAGTFGTVDYQNVIRENKTANRNTATGNGIGQLSLPANAFPMIQLYDLNPTGSVVVTYNKGGGAQSTTLTFDTVDQFANLESDRTVFPTGANVHLTLTDVQLNIDPTDEDSWTWGTIATNNTVFYQLFDENGATAADGSAGAVDLTNSLGTDAFMFEDNGILLIDLDAQGVGNEVLRIIDNDDSVTNGTATVEASTVATGNGTIAPGSQPVTFTELSSNSGLFANYDDSDVSNLAIASDANRGVSASIDYNETPKTVLVGFGFGSIDIQPADDEWNSGEEIPVVLVDSDANQNSRVDEDLDLNNPDVPLIPSLQTGNPFTLGDDGTGGTGGQSAVFTNATIAFTEVNTALPGGQGDPVKSLSALNTTGGNVTATVVVDKFSKRAIIDPSASLTDAKALIIDLSVTAEELFNSISNPQGADISDRLHGFNLFNMDLRSINSTGSYDVYLLNQTTGTNIFSGNNTTAGLTAISLVNDTDAQSISLINSTSGTDISADLDQVVKAIFDMDDSDNIGLLFVFDDGLNSGYAIDGAINESVVADFFTFGFESDGDESGERVANQIIRIEVEETGDNTSTFEGSLEYIMVNQVNILDADTYTGLSPIADDPSFIVIEDLTDEDSPRVNYLDLGADGVSTQVADQEEAPSHSGIVSFDSDSYKTADTVTITLEDLDLNTDSDLVDIYTVVSTTTDDVYDQVGEAGLPTDLSFGDLGRILDITFDDTLWTTPAVNTCTSDGETATGSNELEENTDDTGLGATGFTLVETSQDSGVFIGDFQIPSVYCPSAGTTADPGLTESVTGLDIEVNYVDFRDASGEIIEVGDSAGVRANTGSVSLDRTVYPVPFGVPADFESVTTTETPEGRAIFPVHATGMTDTDNEIESGEFLQNGDLTIHIRVNDPDFDISASGEDEIAEFTAAASVGPVKISVIRGSDSVVLGYAGSPTVVDGVIDVDDNGISTTANSGAVARQLGPLVEIAPDAGIFEIDFDIRYTDGPASQTCPDTEDFTPTNGTSATGDNAATSRFDVAATSGDYCILQGDILQVEYTDPADASGDANTVTDSATFDLRNGVLQSDKSVYIIGSDMILTLIEPDLDLDNDGAETYDLDLIEWDSDAATITMGNLGGTTNSAAFDPEPSNFRETGDSTGIFQIVIEIPEELDNDRLERGEEIILEYTDWGPSGSDFVGDEDEDVNLTIFTSNFGATVELDQKVYSWTDKVYITIVAPDHNFDGDLVDEIGNTDVDPIKISTRGFDLDNYKLVETGTDTGIFTGEVILTGFAHDADGDENDDTNPRTTGSGPTDGFLQTDDDDGLTVSFEFSEDETVVGSSLIRWNIGEVQWLEASYPASGTGVVRVIDPDMNLDPEAVDNFDVDVWSDSDAGGIDLTVTETNEATGIFEGTVFFTVSDESSGHRLRVAEGDTVTAEYEDNTLPDPYTTADELDITATSLIGTVVPPLERAPAANLRTVDAFGNSLDTVSVDQQVQISADLANGQDREQTFAYLVQIQDGNGVTVSLAWITGSLSAGQSFSPALSWIPTESGSYTATAFVWESVDNPTALSPPVSTTVNVN